jgi:transcriptional regulator with XRE-family HTH domain
MKSTFGSEISLIRTTLGFSQSQMAREIGVSGVTVGKWERSEAQITFENLLEVLRAFLRLQVFQKGKEHEEAKKLWLLSPVAQSFPGEWFNKLVSNSSELRAIVPPLTQATPSSVLLKNTGKQEGIPREQDLIEALDGYYNFDLLVQKLTKCPKFGSSSASRQGILEDLPPQMFSILPDTSNSDNNIAIKKVLRAAYNYHTYGLYILLERIIVNEGEYSIEAKELEAFIESLLEIGQLFTYGEISNLKKLILRLSEHLGRNNKISKFTKEIYQKMTSELQQDGDILFDPDTYLYTLAELPDNLLLDFVEELALRCDELPAIQQDLRRWTDNICNKSSCNFDVSLYRQLKDNNKETQPASVITAVKPTEKIYLTVKLDVIGQTRPSGYKVKIWIQEDRPNAHPENYTPASNPERQYESNQELSQILDEVVQDVWLRFPFSTITFEFFLAQEWLWLPIDETETHTYKYGGIGIHFPVVVRVQKRSQFDSWKTRWQEVQCRDCDSIMWISDPNILTNPENFTDSLLNDWKNVGCLGFIWPSSEHYNWAKVEELINAVNVCGVPVVIWPRPSAPEFEPTKIEKYLKENLTGRKLADLPDAIKELRLKAGISSKISILWDDPNRFNFYKADKEWISPKLS